MGLLILIWAVLWAALASALGASIALVLFIGCASVFAPFVLLVIALYIEESMIDRARRKRVKAERKRQGLK